MGLLQEQAVSGKQMVEIGELEKIIPELSGPARLTIRIDELWTKIDARTHRITAEEGGKKGRLEFGNPDFESDVGSGSEMTSYYGGGESARGSLSLDPFSAAGVSGGSGSGSSTGPLPAESKQPSRTQSIETLTREIESRPGGRIYHRKTRKTCG